jgi:hypothetical protein
VASERDIIRKAIGKESVIDIPLLPVVTEIVNPKVIESRVFP